MAKPKKCPEFENHERWLISYADFITLLFAFFVVMYAQNQEFTGKYRVMADSLYGAFRGDPKMLDPIQIGQVSKSPNLNLKVRKKQPDLKVKIVKSTNMSRKINITKTGAQAEVKNTPSKSKDATKDDSTKNASQASVKKINSANKQEQHRRGMDQGKDKKTQRKDNPGDDKKIGKDKNKDKDRQKDKDKKPGKKIKDKTSDFKAQPVDYQARGQKENEKVIEGKLMAKLEKKLKKEFKNLINKEMVKVRFNNKWVELELNNNFFFKHKDYALTQAAIPFIGRVVEILEGYPNFLINVEGHTDNQDVKTNIIESSWQLSALRSASIIHILEDFQVRPDRLTLSSKAQYKPAYDNNSPKNMAKNRRTVLIIKSDPNDQSFLNMVKKMPVINESIFLEE